MPPCSCTHSPRISVDARATYALATLTSRSRVSLDDADRVGRRLCAPLRGLEREQQVGEPMLQRLVRREWATERPAIDEVLDGRRVHVVERADGLRHLQRERELALVLDVGGGVAERRRRRHATGRARRRT